MLAAAGLGRPDEIAPDALHRDLDQGLRFAHIMMSINQQEAREGIVCAKALAELLVLKGLLAKEELETMMGQVSQELAKLPAPQVKLAKSEDKYTCGREVLIDCAERIPLCHAACCTFTFYLTEQDLDEGMVRWDYRRPYWIQHEASGYCTHCDPVSHHCHVHAVRPYVCRAYDCRHDQRVWLDFEQRIPNPKLGSPA